MKLQPAPVAGVRIRDVVASVVAACAPEETVVVEGLLRYSDAEVLSRLRRRRGDRDPLGFGLAEVAPLVAPLVWLTLDQARERLAQAMVDGASRGSASVWQRVLRRRPAPAVIPALTPAQQRVVHRMVLDAAARATLPDEQARRIADGVVAGLVLSDPGEDRGVGPEEVR
ncbi:hypothetical protein ABT143_06770 [Streptomyces sp. NPDC002033]|uniref:hypothetical protein n=1 Tax=unclassified Streptomyces TaxID=2593676 RepID=UPI00331ABC92